MGVMFAERQILVGLVVGYFFLLLWWGMRGHQRSTQGSAFLTGNQSFGWIFCALSLVSTIIGGSATLGMGGLALKQGAAAFWWLGVGAIGLLIHGWLIVPKIRAMNAVTLPEVVDHVAGPWARKVTAVIIALSWVAITAAQFVALFALYESLAGKPWGGVLYTLTVLGILYHTGVGGQRGVIRTDALQAILLLVGFLGAALWLVGAMPERVANTTWQFFSDRFGVLDLVQLMLLVGITYIIGPDMFSRTFAAKSTEAARQATWLATPLMVLFSVVITLLALSNLEAKQPIGDWLGSASALPFILKAMLALGLISALSGSADTVLLSAAGIIERDILGGNRTRVIQWLVFAMGILAALTVFVEGNIIKLLLTGYAFYVPGVAMPLLVSLLLPTRPLQTSVWLVGALLGGLCGLGANFFGASYFTLIGMAISALGALAAWVFPKRGVLVNS